MTCFTLGSFIRQSRGALSLRELARRIGCSPAYLSDVEIGNRMPTDETLTKICKALFIKQANMTEHDTRPPLQEVRALCADPNYAFALRKLVEANLSAGELLACAKKYTEKRKNNVF